MSKEISIFFDPQPSDKARGFKSFNFDLKCACVNKDSFIDYFHLLLVPDEGHSQIVKLHDKPYSDRLFNELRLDIDFIPHVGIANSKDVFKVKRWADQWNLKAFSIRGRINMLTVIDYDGNSLQDVTKIPLREN